MGQRIFAILGVRFLLLVLSSALGSTAFANGTPSFCVNGNTLVLNQTSLQAITSVGQNDMFAGDFDVTFAPVPVQLLGLATGSTIVLPPSTQRPTGLAGEVVSIDDSDNAELIVRVRPTRLPGEQEVTSIPAGLQITTTLGDEDGSCSESDPGVDSSGDGNIDSGFVSGDCKGTTGGDFGFNFEVAENVDINGVISLSPLDMEASAVFSDEEVVAFSFTNKSSISFTGEISADADVALANNVYNLGSIPVGSFMLQVGPSLSASVTIFADAIVGVCGNLSAGTHAGLTASASTEYGFEFVVNGNDGVIAEPADVEVNLSPPELESDTAANVTLYGGAVLRAELNFVAQGVIPIVGTAMKVTALGATSVNIDPNSDPWWEITGQPAVYIDVTPQILFADVDNYSFDIINPGAQTFFDANSEFPFTPGTAAAINDQRTAGGERKAGTAMRWSRGFMSTIDYDMKDIVPLQDGGTIFIGQSTSKSTVIRTDYFGNRVWQRELAGNAQPRSIAQLPDGGFLLSGSIASKLWLLKLTSNGTIQWSREFESEDSNFTSVFIAGADVDGVTLGGELISTNQTEFRPWAARIDNDANVLWANHYGVIGEQELIEHAVGTADGGVFMVGRTSYTPTGPAIPGNNAYTIKVNADGTVAWSHVYAGPNYEHLYGAAQAHDGSYIAVGESTGTSNNSNPRGLIVRLPGDPTPPEPMASRYIHTVGGSYTSSDLWFDKLYSITPQGEGFVFAGISDLGADSKVWLGRFIEKPAEIEMVWSMYYDGADREDIERIVDTGDGLLLAGDSRSFDINGENRALWVTRVPYDGFLNWNADAQTTSQYTPMVTDVPPGNLLPQLAVTAEEDLTVQEQSVSLELTAEESPNFDSVPEAFNQVELVKAQLNFGDTDLDGLDDSLDNCINVANANQEDADNDGFGNNCDADFNNDCAINFIDYVYQTGAFLSSDPIADMNGDGSVNFVDLSLFSAAFLQSPGPSALAQCD